MTNRKAPRAQTPEPKPAETVGNVAATDESSAAAPTPETDQGTVAEQPTAGADDGALAPAAPAVVPEPKPAKAKPLDPADDPTAGITGVPVQFVPTPAVP